MQVAGVTARYVNGACCVNISHKRRIQMVTAFSIISFLGISYASMFTDNENMFYLALFSSIFMGIAASFGEGIVIGFLKAFPAHMVGDFGSGTGFSGPFSTLTLLVLRSNGLSDSAIFMI